MAELLGVPSTFLLFSAPPAWGKTAMVLGLCRSFPGRVVFLSPLRALAQEFRDRAAAAGLRPEVLVRRGGADPPAWRRRRRSLLVATPETLDEGLWGAFEAERPLFVLDEFHLFLRWGEDFRPVLREALMRAAASGSSVLALSATMEPDLLERCRREVPLSVASSWWIDRGNMSFLHPPRRAVFMGRGGEPALRLAAARCLGSPPGRRRRLVFCRRRREVGALVGILADRGVRVLGCVGGGAAAFREAARDGAWDAAVATTCLSHGVNLPPMDEVLITWRTGARDLWMQMAARGGRAAGRPWDLYHCDPFAGTPLGRAWDALRLLSLDGLRRLRLSSGL